MASYLERLVTLRELARRLDRLGTPKARLVAVEARARLAALECGEDTPDEASFEAGLAELMDA